MKVGLVGLGFMGSTHLKAYRKIGDAEVVAVASSEPQKLAGDASAAQGNLDSSAGPLDLGDAARHGKAEDLIADPNVEAVDLCVPTHLHAPLALAALRAGKHVLVEKPMALTGDDCDAMIAAARENQRVLMVAHVLRFWPDYREAARLVRSGELGRVLAATFRRKCATPGWSAWMRDPQKSGGGVFDLLIHDFDYCLHILGKPAAVAAVGVEDARMGVDWADVRLDYASGVPVSISGGWFYPSGYPFSMEFSIVLEGGTLDFHSAMRRLTIYRAGGEVEEPKLPERDAFESELEAFLQSCDKGEAPPENRPEDSAVATRLALAMKESRARKGASVQL